MSQVYMYTYFTDLVRHKYDDSEEICEMLLEQNRRDLSILNILKYEEVPRFPMNKNKFNDYHDLFLQLSIDDTKLVLIFVMINKCVAYNNGEIYTYDCLKDAENDLLNVSGKYLRIMNKYN